MPFPVLHAFAGYSIYTLSKNKQERNWKLAFYCIFLANAADLDYIPGIIIGKAGHFHHGITHSFGVALLVGLLAALGAGLWKKRSAMKSFLISFSAYASHIILDLSNGHCKGMPLFWPLSSRHYTTHFKIDYLEGAKSVENADLAGFIHHLTSGVCIKRFVLEVIFVSSVWLLIFIRNELKKSKVVPHPFLNVLQGKPISNK